MGGPRLNLLSSYWSRINKNIQIAAMIFTKHCRFSFGRLMESNYEIIKNIETKILRSRSACQRLGMRSKLLF